MIIQDDSFPKWEDLFSLILLLEKAFCFGKLIGQIRPNDFDWSNGLQILDQML